MRCAGVSLSYCAHFLSSVRLSTLAVAVGFCKVVNLRQVFFISSRLESGSASRSVVLTGRRGPVPGREKGPFFR